MMKRFLTLLLAVALGVTACLLPAAAAEPADPALEAVQALGIVTGDENGDLMLTQSVTRAQFVTMMTRASVYKDSISAAGSGYSLFKDVKSSHWASEYVRLAVAQGWASGYTDGTFRPEQSITLEEACTMLLRLLGYESSSLAGSFPYAQLSKASALGLRDEVRASQGEAMSRADCVQLFYNLLTAETATGQVYATTLGYPLVNGEVDYAAVVKDSLSGPYIASGGDTLPFTPTTVYRDGKRAASASLNLYDVYYYNASLRTLWVYTDRAAGKLTALAPSSTAPTSVTVAGRSYTIGSASAAYQLSTLGGGSTGSVVTLLLGMDEQVVGVVSGDEAEMLYYGVVQSSEKAADTDTATVERRVTVACTDGVSRTFSVSKDASFSVGALVSVTVSNGGVSLKTLSTKSLSGKFTAERFGGYTLADNVKIVDTTDAGDAVAVEPTRLAGCTLTSGSVRYYALNANGELAHLILKNATGDALTYAYLTAADDQSAGISIAASYTYLLNGTERTLRTSGKAFSVQTGGVAISYESDGSIRSMQQLASVKLTSLGTLTATAGNSSYDLADDVQVYLRDGSSYYAVALASVNADDYTLTGWYDTASGAAAGRLRVILAVEK